MRLPGSEDWPPRDIEAQIAFERGFADDASLLLREFYEANYGPEASKLASFRPTEGLYARGKAAELAFATADVELGISICLEIIAKEKPSTLMQAAYFAVLGSVAGAIKVQPLPNGALIFMPNNPKDGLRFLFPQDDSDFAAMLMRLFLPAVAASGGLTASFSFHGLEDIKPQTMEKFSVSHEFRALLEDGQSASRRYERSAAILALETQYSARLSIMRRDHYHWNLMQPRGPIIDWPLLCTWVAISRFSQIFGPEEIPVPNEDARFIRWLATEIVTRETRPPPRRSE